MKASIKWTEGMAFEADLEGYKFFIDADEQFGGKKKGPKPKGLTLVSLAGCTGMDVISILGKMRVAPQIEHFEVATDAVIEKDFPKRILEIEVKYIFKGNDLPVDKLKQAIELSRETYCGVSATLKPTVKLSYRLIVNDLDIAI
jgi:putative redox protein